MAKMPDRTIDMQLVRPFVDATTACLTQMTDVSPACVRTFIKDDPAMHGDIIGVIGLSGGLAGSCAVSFPEALARHIVARFLIEPESALTAAMVTDGVGEIANMVAGGAKPHFAMRGFRFSISTPTVVVGARTRLFDPGGVACFASEFTLAGMPGSFLVEIALRAAKPLA
jgi:chemotaxis protein CheX